jgi:adenylosuccinate lyase
MELNAITAISPIDGRYRRNVKELAQYFSEFGLIKYRVKVEVEYFIALCEAELPQLENVSADLFPALRDIYINFNEEDANWIKTKEVTETNHDVKAVEYFVKKKLQELGLEKNLEFVHFGLTSQDINNTANPLMLKDAIIEVYVPALEEIIEKLTQMARDWMNIPLLARTHGQPASPTRLGKEIYVFVERIQNQFEQLKTINFSAKFGGATGNFNAHQVAFPSINWIDFGNQFVTENLELNRYQFTTQIEHYDDMASLYDGLKRINTILIDFDRDVWQYVAMNYFKQKINPNETGSSAMPHKVNPIDFENSEGNLGIANAIFEHLSAKLPISRLQRDLTDSTVLRNLGVPISHTLIAFKSTLKGLSKLELNPAAIAADLEDNWAVVSEGIQTILRRESYPKPYEALKELTRKNTKITEESIKSFITTLNVSDSVKAELLAITPYNYVGVNWNDSYTI